MHELTIVLRRSVAAAALAAALAVPAASAQVENGSFETGDFTGWTATDLANPLNPLEVQALGAIGYFGPTLPTDGDFSVLTGFDGAGPGTIVLEQDLLVPTASTLLLLDYTAVWDMLTIATNSTLDRTFRIVVQESGGGAELASFELLRAAAQSASLDADRVTAAVSLAEFAGEELRLALAWDVPEDFTGPAQFDLDNVRLVGKKLPKQGAAGLKLALDFDTPGKDSLKLELYVPVADEFVPDGQALTVEVGDLVKEFVLDAKGAAKVDGDKVKLLPAGKVPGQRRLMLTCKQGSFADAFAPHGLLDADTPKEGITVSVPVSVVLDGDTTARSFVATWKSTAGKGGKAGFKAASEAWTPKLSVKLDLAEADGDSIELQTIALTDAGFTPEGHEVVVDVGGVRKTFTLDAAGEAVAGPDSIRLARDKKSPARQVVTLECAAGNFGDVSEDFFQFKGDTPSGGLDVIVPVSVLLDGREARRLLEVNYKATAGKSGKAKG